jgi:hypothetical protein
MATRDLIGKRGEAIATARLMSVTAHEREVLIEKRARALTMMLLTRREDLLVDEVKDDIGLDYIIRFHSKGKAGLREFAVQVTGAWPAATKDDADQSLRPALQQLNRYGPFLRPVCLFLFTMENDGAWYTRFAEPIHAEGGKPLLQSRDRPDCRPLDMKSLKEIIEQVDVWHDALFPGLTVNGPGGSKTSRKAAKA